MSVKINLNKKETLIFYESNPLIKHKTDLLNLAE